MENENENNNSPNVEEENVNSENDTSEVEEVEETEDVKALKQANKELFARAKKAEGFVLEDGKWVKKPKPEKKPETKPEPEPAKEPGMSFEDTYALIKANIHKDDISEITDYAKLKGITISEALNANVIKTLLADKAEQRKVAEATNVKSSSRSVAKSPSELDVYNKAEKGEYPSDPAELAKARTAKLRGGK